MAGSKAYFPFLRSGAICYDKRHRKWRIYSGELKILDYQNFWIDAPHETRDSLVEEEDHLEA